LPLDSAIMEKKKEEQAYYQEEEFAAAAMLQRSLAGPSTSIPFSYDPRHYPTGYQHMSMKVTIEIQLPAISKGYHLSPANGLDQSDQSNMMQDEIGVTHTFYKYGWWNGEPVTFVLFRDDLYDAGYQVKKWFLGVSGGEVYFASKQANLSLPPENAEDWNTFRPYQMHEEFGKRPPMTTPFIIVGTTKPSTKVKGRRRRNTLDIRFPYSKIGGDIREANGVYSNSKTLSDEVPLFIKHGKWFGSCVTYVIFRSPFGSVHQKYWFVGINGGAILFSNDQANLSLPPKKPNSWVPFNDSHPQLRPMMNRSIYHYRRNNTPASPGKKKKKKNKKQEAGNDIIL